MNRADPARPPRGASAIRPALPGDVPGLKAVIDATGLFPSEMLDAMMAPYLEGQPGGGRWLADDGVGLAGVAFYAPERMTAGTWNLYLIAIHPICQGVGRGSALLRHAEASLAAEGGRLLLVETSGLPSFARTRAFYRANGYGEEARIRDFYQAGEDKVVFSKPL